MSVELSLLFYVSLFFVSGLLMWWGVSRANKLIIGASLAIPILVASLRMNVGTDYANYVLMFNDMKNISLDKYFADVFPTVELGFYALIKLSDFVVGGPFFMFFASAAMITLFFWTGLKKYNVGHPALVYFLYLMIVFPTTLNGVRQGIAAAICFYAITFIISRKPLSYFLWVFVASLFHVSALFLIPLYLLNLVIRNKGRDSIFKTIFIILVALSALVLSLPYVFTFLESIPLFASYVQYLVPVDDGASSNFYSKALIVIIAIILSKWLVSSGEKNKYHYFIIFTIIEIMISTFGFSATVDRMALYFSFFSLFLISSFTNLFNDVLGKTITTSLLVTYGFVYFYIAYYVQNYGDIMPYQSII